MTYQPPMQRQYGPVTSQSQYDCVPTTCAMGADRSTVGAIHVDHTAIRKASGITGRGLSYEEAVAATVKATGVQGMVRYGISTGDLTTLLLAGHSLTISIDTHATAGTPYQTNGFLGNHSVYGNAFYSTNQTVNVKDPGTSANYLNWPLALVVKAAQLRTRYHGINVIVWPDTEGVARVAVGTVKLYDSPYRTSKVVKTYPKGTKLIVTSTFNGGGWLRADGGTSFGWGRFAGDVYVPGRSLR